MIQWSCDKCGCMGMSGSPDLVPPRCPHCQAELPFRTPNWDRVTYDEPGRSRFQKGFPDDTRSITFKTAEHHNDLSWDCLQREDFRQALKHFEDALQACSEFPMAWNNKGWAHYRLGEVEEAKSAYVRSAELAPTFAMPRLNLGVLHLESDNKQEARLWFDKAIAADPDDKQVAAYVRKVDWT